MGNCDYSEKLENRFAEYTKDMSDEQALKVAERMKESYAYFTEKLEEVKKEIEKGSIYEDWGGGIAYLFDGYKEGGFIWNRWLLGYSLLEYNKTDGWHEVRNLKRETYELRKLKKEYEVDLSIKSKAEVLFKMLGEEYFSGTLLADGAYHILTGEWETRESVKGIIERRTAEALKGRFYYLVKPVLQHMVDEYDKEVEEYNKEVYEHNEELLGLYGEEASRCLLEEREKLGDIQSLVDTFDEDWEYEIYEDPNVYLNYLREIKKQRELKK